MENQKADLEKKVSELTAVFSEMLGELAKLYDSKEELKKELETEERNFNNMQLIVDCVNGRLNEAKRALNAFYNNEDYTPLGKFVFCRSMVHEDKPDEKQAAKDSN